MDRPPIFRFLGGLARVLPYRLLRLSIRALVWAALGRGRPRRLAESLFARILAHQGRPAGPAVLRRLAAERDAFYAETLANLCVLARDRDMPRPAREVELEFLPALRAVLARGKGAILASPHLGDLYTSIAAIAHAGVPLHVLLAWGEKYRWLQFKGLRFLDLGTGAADLLKALASNEPVFLHVDLDYFPGGRTADFFGAPVHPPDGTARLALASGAPILPVYCVVEDGRYKVLAGEPIAPNLPQEEIERRLLRSHEERIGRQPAQWLMFHDMWDLGGNRMHRYLRAPLPMGVDALQTAPPAQPVAVVPYGAGLAPGTAYAVLEDAAGWSGGHTVLSVSRKRRRKPDGTPYPAREFLDDLGAHVARVARAFAACGLRGYLVYATEDAELCLLRWESAERMRAALQAPESKVLMEEVARLFEPQPRVWEELESFSGRVTRSFLEAQLERLGRRP